MNPLRSIADLVIGGFNNIGSALNPNIIDRPPFIPTYTDIRIARAFLKGFGLPTEVVLEILDCAQYIPIRTYTTKGQWLADVSGGHVCLDADILGLQNIRELQATKVKTKVQKIEFDIRSRDQGWTSEGTKGTFNTSSWLEVSILRPGNADHISRVAYSLSRQERRNPDTLDPEKLQRALQSQGDQLVQRPAAVQQGAQGGDAPFAWYLQGNRVGTSQPQPYHIVWSLDPEQNEGNEGSGSGQGFLEALSEGDKVLVWARAKYPGWQCIVVDLNVTVHYKFEE